MMRSPRGNRRSQGEGTPDDDGFVLLESIIAISLITIIMSALAVFFLNTVASATQQRNRVGAIQLANSTVENLRSRDASAKTLLAGRDTSSVATQFGAGTAPTAGQATSAPVQSWLTEMDYGTAVDTAATGGSGATATIPTSPTSQVMGKITYLTNQYLGYCYLTTTGSNTDCVEANNGSTIQYLRAVVAVAWNGAHCNTVSCTYVTSTLISPTSDPTFQTNQPLPAAPVVDDPGPQVNAVGDTVAVQMTVQNNTGVPNFTWNATGLPTGLAMNPAGLVSNSGALSVTASPAPTVTVTVTDAFLRTASVTFSWTIKPQLVITPPAAQANTTTDVVDLTLTATGGEGAPYTWASTSLPPGLSISSSGTIAGTPTTVGQYNNVVVTVTDASTTRTATATLTWTVTYPPLAASNPGPKTSTISTAITGLQLSASGGSGSYSWADATVKTLPAGLVVSSGGLITGTPTTVGSKTVTLTVTDATAAMSQSVTFTWSIVAKPTVTSPGTKTNTVTTTLSPVSLLTSCPNSPCAYTFSAGQVHGLSISSAGVISGTFSTVGTYAATIRVTDAAGAFASTAAFTWNVKAAPTTGTLAATNKTSETANKSVGVTFACPNTSCTITLTGAVPGLGLSTVSTTTGNNTTSTLVVATTSGTVYIAGTTQTTAVTTGTSQPYSLSLKIVDTAGVASTPTTSTWTAYTPPTQAGIANGTAFTSPRGSTLTQAMTYTCPVSTCTITMTGQPLTLGVDADTAGTPTASLAVNATSGGFYARGVVSATATTGVYTIIIKIADSNTASVSITVTMTVT
jgi:type II secretory pathway pseudopilin PulG